VEDQPQGRLEAALRGEVDWRGVASLAAEHDVVPLVYHHLKTSFADAVPASTLHTLRDLYLHRLRRSIQIRGELPRLLSGLRAHGVNALAFKGPALAALAYANENLRTFTDLDLLIREERVDPAVEALREMGFREKRPMPSAVESTWATYRPWHAPHGNANGFVRDAGDAGELHLDLHWGLASRYFQFPMEPEALWDRQVLVSLDSGSAVPTFSPEDTLLVQCMHAAKDAYYRLSHTCDIAEVLRARPTLDIEVVLDRADALRCGRMVRLGLHLSHNLLGAPLPGDVRERVLRDEAVAPLAEKVTSALFHSRHGVRRLLHLSWFHLRVRDRMRDGWGAVYHAVRTSLHLT